MHHSQIVGVQLSIRILSTLVGTTFLLVGCATTSESGAEQAPIMAMAQEPVDAEQSEPSDGPGVEQVCSTEHITGSTRRQRVCRARTAQDDVDEAAAELAAAEPDDPNEVICRTERTTGSNRRRRICRTRAQRAEDAERSLRHMTDIGRRASPSD
jgi:PBP1b-binding outer membrane lipoprotein LpoB